MSSKTLLPYLVGVVGLLHGAAADTSVAQHLYGDSATYLVTRGEVPVGTHRLVFAGDAARLTVTAKTRATLSLLGIFDVPFIYDSQAVWQRGTLLTLSSSFSRGGGKHNWLRKAGDGYQTQSGAASSAPLLPTNHWNHTAMQQQVLYNTLSGRLVNVRVRRGNEETLLIGGEETTARRYDLSGDLEISLWYDDDGKWLRLQFRALGNDYQFTYQPDGGG